MCIGRENVKKCKRKKTIKVIIPKNIENSFKSTKKENHKSYNPQKEGRKQLKKDIKNQKNGRDDNPKGKNIKKKMKETK